MSQMIYLRDGLVMVEAVAIEDPVAYELLEAIESDEERAEMLADFVEIGARAIRHRQDGDQVDVMRREMEILRSHVEGLLSDAGTGFVQGMRPVLESLGTSLSAISARLDTVAAISQSQVELQRERDRGTAKGRDFEEAVAHLVDQIARHQGDSCEHVGDVGGFGGRAGDVAVDIGAAEGPSQGRIVFEVKTGRLSRPEAMRELDRAKQARDADFAVLVVPDIDKLPADVFELREYGGDKLIVSTDDSWGQHALVCAYSLARARVLLRRREKIEGVDDESARNWLEHGLQKLDDVRAIRLRLTGIAKQAGETNEIVERMVDEVRYSLDEAVKALLPET